MRLIHNYYCYIITMNLLPYHYEICLFILGALVCSCCYDKVPQSGWLKQEKLIFSWFWRLQNPRSSFQQGWCLLRGLPLGCRRLSSYHVFTWPFLGVCACGERKSSTLVFLYLRALILLDQDPTLTTSFNQWLLP